MHLRCSVYVLGLLFCFICSSPQAGTIDLVLSDRGWSITFDGPMPVTTEETAEGNIYKYRGRIDRLNVELVVGKSICPPTELKPQSACVLRSIAGLEGVIVDSIQTYRHPEGVKVAFIARNPDGHRLDSTMHLRLLFYRDGISGELDVSAVTPQLQEIQAAFKLINSVQLVRR